MDVRSLGLRTDLMIRRLAGSEITDHGDHLVVRTPGNPSFYWGNFLAFPAPLHPGDAGRWEALFARYHPAARHRAYAVDDPSGTVGDHDELAALEVEASVMAVLTAPAPLPRPKVGARPEIRAVSSAADWRQLLDVRLACEDEAPDADHAQFLTRQIAEARRLAESGVGTWFGAVADGRIVATLGVFSDGAGAARYQNVETDPAYRRRGLARALLIHASEYAARQLGAHTVVIVAEYDYHALDLYRSVGFGDTEKQVQLTRAPSRS
jgi:ribosomal protein S18 acetylase RimI-like enzyme